MNNKFGRSKRCQRSFSKKHIAIAVGLGTTTLLSVGAVGQEESADRVIEEVLVTAQKREQSAQEVPAGLFAISGEDLERVGVANLDEIEQVAAGITLATANPDQINISMRGVSNISSNFIAGPASGVYVDEAPVSAFSSSMPQLALWDAERVEVLRGPQGTLFGEGSMGGTLRVITAKPDASELSGRVMAGYESVDDGEAGYILKGVLNVPIIKDKLALRVNAAQNEINGWVDVPDLAEEDANSGEQSSLRVALRWTPNDDVTIDASYERNDVEIDNDFFATSPGRYQPSELNPAFGPVQFLSTRDTETELFSLTLNYDLDFATLVATGSFFESDFQSIGDRSYVLPVFFGLPGTATAPFNTTVEADTQEIRLVSKGDSRLQWTVGAYRKDDDRSNPNSGFIFEIPALEPLIGTPRDEALNTVTSSNEAYAFFGDVEYNLTDTFAVSGGVRHYEADYEQITRFDTTSLLLGTVEGEVRGEGDSSETTFKLGASWSPRDNVLFYARYAEGFRDGGVNPNAQPARPEIPADFGPETIDSFELGVKSQPVDWLQVSAAIFRNEWSDLQLGFVTSDGLLGFTDTAGTAEADGLELELVALPLKGLQIGLNFSYLDAEITEEVTNAFGMVLAEEGNAIPFSPEYQASLSASYAFDLTDGLGGMFTANYAYRDEIFSTAENFESEVNEAYELLYLSAGINGEKWNANVYVSNALNEDATYIKGRFVTALPEAFSGFLQPRTLGAQITYAF